MIDKQDAVLFLATVVAEKQQRVNELEHEVSELEGKITQLVLKIATIEGRTEGDA